MPEPSARQPTFVLRKVSYAKDQNTGAHRLTTLRYSGRCAAWHGLIASSGQVEYFRTHNDQILHKGCELVQGRKVRSLAPLLPIRNALVALRNHWFNRFWGMDVHPTARISLKAHLDKTNPVGIHIGEYTTVTFGVAILAHDMARNIMTDTRIGKNCFIGAHSVILPGVTIGDGSIVAAGSVVNRDVPPRIDRGWQPCQTDTRRDRNGPIRGPRRGAPTAADECRTRWSGAGSRAVHRYERQKGGR